MSLCKTLFAGFLVLTFCENGWGQAARSPFSSFALGEYYGNAQAHSQGMSGVGLSNPQYWYLNNQNPALLVFNPLTSFQAGIVGEHRSVTDGTTTERNGSGNLNYLLLGVPVKRSKRNPSQQIWTTSIALTPYTTVNYKYTYTRPIENSPATEVDTEEGSGGINQLSWSHGVALHKYLSIGARANYLFSSIENKYSNVVTAPNQFVIVNPYIYERYYYKDFSFTGAMSLHVDSLTSKNLRLNIGAVYDFKANVRTQLFETLVRSINNVEVVDTLASTSMGNTLLPPSLSVGISFGQQDRWMIGIDGKLTDFSSFRDFENNQLRNAQKGWKAALGGEFTPDPTSLGSYLKRMTYRTGVSLEEYPYLIPSINGKPVRDFGINFGLSLPVSWRSSVDLAMRWGKRGNIGNNSIEENYFKIYFGVTFNDQWFIKRRFD